METWGGFSHLGLTIMKTAKLIKDNLHNFAGHAALYELDPPIKGKNKKSHKRVIVSTANVMFSGPGTYIFPAKADTEDVEDWGELKGSYRGGMSHSKALEGSGYSIA